MSSDAQAVIQGVESKIITVTTSSDQPGDKVVFKLEIDENEIRARQFACHLTIHNDTKNSIHLLAINYRLGSTVKMQKTETTSFVDLKQEYDRLKEDVQLLLRSIYVTQSKEFAKEYSIRFLDAFKSIFSFKFMAQNLWLAYVYIFSFRFAEWRRYLSNKLFRMDFPVASAAEAEKAARTLMDKGIGSPVVEVILMAKIARMKEIEGIDENFLRPEFIGEILPGEIFERIYILKARRNLASIASYTAAFDVKLAWDEPIANSQRRAERMLSKSISFNVTPSPITLSIVAVLFSFLGTILNSVPIIKDQYSELFTFEFAKKYFVAAVLAIVIFNSLEITEFKDRFRSISWRSAMFVGLLCGLLSDKMLKAVTSFVQ